MRKKLFLFLIIGILAIFAAGCGSEETDKSADKDNDKANTVNRKAIRILWRHRKRDGEKEWQNPAS